MAFFFRELWALRRRHLLCVISLSLSFLLVMTLDYSGSRIERVFEDFAQSGGLQISMITGDEIINEEGLIRTFYSAYGDYQVILADEHFYRLFSLDYHLETAGIYDERITVGYEVFLEHFFMLDLNGTILKVKNVIAEDYENIYFDASKVIILPLKYLFLFPDAQKRYFLHNDDKARYEQMGYEVISLQQSQKALLKSADLIRGFMILLSLVGLLAAAASFISHSLSLLRQKEREIGIKKAFGASDKDIFFEQLVESLFLVLVSFAFSIIVFNLILLKTKMEKEPVIPGSLSLISVVLIALFCGIFPATKAAGTNISDAIRTGV